MHDPIDPCLCRLRRLQVPLVPVLQALQFEGVACPHLLQSPLVQAQLFLQPGSRLGLSPLEPRGPEPPHEPGRQDAYKCSHQGRHRAPFSHRAILASRRAPCSRTGGAGGVRLVPAGVAAGAV
jgi:hypothetical protein